MLATGALLVIYDFGAHPWLFLVTVASSFALLVLWSRRYGDRPVALSTLLVVAALLRILVLPLPQSLSDDVYRYLWDGKVLLAGYNPYALAPDSDSLASLRDENWERTAHREVETVYPPFALGLFSIAAALPAPLVSYRLLLGVLDLAGCLLLFRLARRIGVPTGRTVWYAWNPLVVLEGVGMGHIDVAGVAAVIATVLLLVRMQQSGRTAGRSARRIAVTAAATACAGVLLKLVPVVALPMWIRQSRSRWLLLAVAAVLLTSALMVTVTTGGFPPGLVTYGVSWEFNGPVFEPLWRLLDRVEVVPAVKWALERLKQVVGGDALWNRFYPYVYPQFLAKLLLAVGVLVAMGLSLRESCVSAGTGRLLMRVSVLSATLYPWYATWALPFAALHRFRSWWLLSFTLQLAYLPRLFGVEYFPWVYLAVWGPPAAWSLREGWTRRT